MPNLISCIADYTICQLSIALSNTCKRLFGVVMLLFTLLWKLAYIRGVIRRIDRGVPKELFHIN